VARAVVVVHLWKAMLWWVGDDVLVIWVLRVLRVFRVFRVLRVSWWGVSEVVFVAAVVVFAVVVFAVVVFAVVAVAVSLLGRVLFGVGAHRCLNDLGCRCWSCS
jgi:hypothetical protein